jgi:malonyl-CoA O-methyltransferase
VGAAADCSRLIDMHDWGDALLHAGLSDPVMDMETLTLNYSTPGALLAELRQLLPTKPSKAGLKNNARTYRDNLTAQLQTAATPLPLTVELVYGHAFKVARLPRQASVSLDSLRQSLPSQKSGGKAE